MLQKADTSVAEDFLRCVYKRDAAESSFLWFSTLRVTRKLPLRFNKGKDRKVFAAGATLDEWSNLLNSRRTEVYAAD